MSEKKDLGVVFHETLSAEKHLGRIAAVAYSSLVRLRLAFNYMDADMLRKILIYIIRPQLEYAAVVWSPYKVKDRNKLERVQRAATKIVDELKQLSYEKRLEILNLPTLEERRLRGDLINVFKNKIGLERIDAQNCLVWNISDRRGHGYKLIKTRCRRDVKLYSFPVRCVDAWNSLGIDIVNAECVGKFKERLDKAGYGQGDRTARA